jgi:hypothetical protein
MMIWFQARWVNLSQCTRAMFWHLGGGSIAWKGVGSTREAGTQGTGECCAPHYPGAKVTPARQSHSSHAHSGLGLLCWIANVDNARNGIANDVGRGVIAGGVASPVQRLRPSGLTTTRIFTDRMSMTRVTFRPIFDISILFSTSFSAAHSDGP